MAEAFAQHAWLVMLACATDATRSFCRRSAASIFRRLRVFSLVTLTAIAGVAGGKPNSAGDKPG